MDWFLIKSVNAEYPLSCGKCVEKWTFCVLCPAGPPKCVTHPQKMVPPYSLGTWPPTNPKTLWSPIAPSSRKNWFSEGIFFWQITRMALESPKLDICQNWPRKVLGDIIRCLKSKFDKKIPMRSVPNCRKEIPARHAIRWFKCKLKPPKQKWQASTTTHDLFVNNLKISPTFICRGEVPSNTFAKLPVDVLINDPKNWTQKVHYNCKPIICYVTYFHK